MLIVAASAGKVLSLVVVFILLAVLAIWRINHIRNR
jgi:hypothetical protein